MDIVLQVADTLLLDRIYAALLPISPSSFPEPKVNESNSLPFGSQEAASLLPQFKYTYEPASKYLHLDPTEWAYKSSWPRDTVYRQFVSLFMITWLFGSVLYFGFATLSYFFVFDKETMKHPKFLNNQVRKEIAQACQAMPGMAFLTALCMLAEVRGYSKLFDQPSEAPFPWYNFLQFPLFILFTDCGIYWIHRGLHHPLVYKTLHKPHHRWIMPTPFASYAFHPVDGFCQSIPYHLFTFVLPLQKVAFIALFTFINFWTILIHDGEFYANNPVINGAACHSAHHAYFNYNYGQFTTLWDRLGGSYRRPNMDLFHKETKMGKRELDRQTEETEEILKEVEGQDDRDYLVEETEESKPRWRRTGRSGR
ncbi:uncharacterized protein Z520_05201 [Fonsecaea multimorphosa CBS 102226]|uniref:Fatty acid hydroxylase domain-containing protein n=1 Tax=Fonsecaea multimorphosa CBS 102226 TaxID=1442371 RepID=A0A0D2HA29_9EURO|nr:uncharacterized protein Z520_05201 [Fonsecaea multimorphosa CBS 102226]KIX98740.1 hypothetical protein Z520_05201 [Fonsecaea multimorphosa CBS 102226]OAL25024.1 hypothetical protein AYO22_04901 [Fonsecaea multimorphosa]